VLNLFVGFAYFNAINRQLVTEYVGAPASSDDFKANRLRNYSILPSKLRWFWYVLNASNVRGTS
jgi:hypothetical protein